MAPGGDNQIDVMITAARANAERSGRSTERKLTCGGNHARAGIGSPRLGAVHSRPAATLGVTPSRAPLDIAGPPRAPADRDPQHMRMTVRMELQKVMRMHVHIQYHEPRSVRRTGGTGRGPRRHRLRG